MHRFIYLIYAGLVIALVYMVVMPFVLLHDDKTEEVGEVSYYIPEEGLQSHYHKEVEMTKGKYSSRPGTSDESQ
ncbi:hypothetical protein MMG00_03295 [Ignatzschineria rhizosphaerae]|uniref:Uncharacterized protein n=1 Tax=Ignatzschineria rhizosphaerae TaxID=2923279 RepID=A0ABY3X3Q2_9GAMM|nr:hypothetical protein [Ignatzschineria rhizosphaerae]UNM96890.1 hypothetical protein MMG00_03295 [Ignatzschineria rhizosphaerae]